MEHDLENLACVAALPHQIAMQRVLSSRYSLRFTAHPISAWHVVRGGEIIVSTYTLPAFGAIAGELALRDLRELQAMERQQMPYEVAQ